MQNQPHTQSVMFKVDKQNEYDASKNQIPLNQNELYSKLNKSINKGRWNKKEHIMFLHGIVKYGNNWKKIKELIKTRSNAQARSHGQKFFIKLREHKQFSFGPFINIKHFFHKIKEYTHSQKQMLLQELKAIPFDSEEHYDDTQIGNEDGNENESTSMLNHNQIMDMLYKYKSSDLNDNYNLVYNINSNALSERGCFGQGYQDANVNSMQSTTVEDDVIHSNNKINGKLKQNENLNMDVFQTQRNCNQLMNSSNYNLNQINLDSLLTQQQLHNNNNKYNLLLSSLLLNSYLLINQQILNTLITTTNIQQ